MNFLPAGVDSIDGDSGPTTPTEQQRPWSTGLWGIILLAPIAVFTLWSIGAVKGSRTVMRNGYTLVPRSHETGQKATFPYADTINQYNTPTLPPCTQPSPAAPQDTCVCGAATLPGWVPPPQLLPLLDYKNESLWGTHSTLNNVQLERFWTQDTLKNALVVAPTAQMHAVFEKLYKGAPLTVVAFGSSITHSYGGFYEKSRTSRGWLELFMRYINTTFPHPGHMLLNAGRFGQNPSTIAVGTCIEAKLPQKADILIIETMGPDDALGIERLLWRVLRHFQQNQGSPVSVILLTPFRLSADPPPQGFPKFGILEGDTCQQAPNWPAFQKPEVNYSTCCVNYKRVIDTAWSKSNFGGEGPHHSLAEYYGIASISHRAFLWPYYLEKIWEKMKLPYGECEFFALINSDLIHPSRLGQILVADYLWTYMSHSHEAYLRTNKLRKWVTSNEELLSQKQRILPVYPFIETGRDVYKMQCYGNPDARKDDGSDSGLPVVGRSGFNFTIYTTHGVPKRKPGWVGNKTGDFIDFKINAAFPPENGRSSSANNETQQQPEIVVMYLESYQHMGKANISCIHGCRCDPNIVNAHIEKYMSITAAATLHVTEQHAECILRVQVLDETDSGQNKFKISQLVVRQLVTSHINRN